MVKKTELLNRCVFVFWQGAKRIGIFMEALCIAQWEPYDATLMPVFNEQENSTHEDLPILYPDEPLLDYETLHKTPLPNDRELELEALVQKQNNEICELNQRINLLLKNTLQPPERVWVVLKIANVNRAMCGFLFVDIDGKTKSTTMCVKHHNCQDIFEETFVLPNQCNAWQMQTLRACPDEESAYHSVSHFHMCGTLIFSLYFQCLWDRLKFDSMMRDIV